MEPVFVVNLNQLFSCLISSISENQNDKVIVHLKNQNQNNKVI